MLQPYQMVRSLQLLQDRIAAGDHAAIPMQRKLLDMIDARFKDTESEDYNDLRNFRAMLIYAMSGGNPRTIETALARIHLDATNRTLGIAIVNYLRGNYLDARKVMETLDPMAVDPELGAFFALVKGSIQALDQPAAALQLFAQARLLSPGTLVEEAALRRTIAIAASSKDAAKFFQASEQYVRRFLVSPYASQFADAFVAGVIQLNDKADRRVLAEVVADMDTEQRKTIYLRLARRSAIDGNSELAAYASGAAEAIEIEGFGPQGDPRAQLYASIATVTSETVDETLAKLGKIDRNLLSEGDQKLLDAAASMAAGVVGAPKQEPVAEPVVKPATAPPAENEDEAGLIPEDEETGGSSPGSQPADKAMPKVAPPAGDVAETAPETDIRSTSLPATTQDPQAAVVTAARQKLDEIDKLLGEAQ